MSVTEQEANELKRLYKIIDYELGDFDNQLNAMVRRKVLQERIKERADQKYLDRTRIVAHLKSGGEYAIDYKNNVEVELFVKLKDEGLIEILEPKRNNYIARIK